MKKKEDTGQITIKDSIERLSNREKEIILMMFEGIKQKEISKILNISFKTVNTLYTRAMLKLKAYCGIDNIIIFSRNLAIELYKQENNL